jgi:hypothetical protein
MVPFDDIMLRARHTKARENTPATQQTRKPDRYTNEVTVAATIQSGTTPAADITLTGSNASSERLPVTTPFM